jgi:predicted CoA-binding protein
MTEVHSEGSDNAPSSDEIKKILTGVKKIAIVGLSPKEERDSHKVAKYLLDHGYDVVPVNPGQKEILGKTCFKTLKDIPFPIDVADLFLNPRRIPPIVEQAIEIGVKVIWMQLGVIHNEAARKAREAGVIVVMDKCIKQEHEEMFPAVNPETP